MKTRSKSAVVLALACFVVAGLAVSASAKKSSTQHTRVFNSAIVSGAPIASGTTAPSTLTVTIKGVSHNVIVPSTAKIVRRYNGTAAFSEIMKGDKLQVWGTIDTLNPLIINATRVRDNSIQKLGASFQGTVANLTNEGVGFTAPASFMVTTKHRGTQTVQVDPTFTLRPFKGVSKLVSDLKLNDQIMVKGIWNTNTKTIYDVNWIKIKRLAPVTPTP